MADRNFAGEVPRRGNQGASRVLKFAPYKVLRSLCPWRRTLALASTMVFALTAISAPALGFELFGRKFFEREDQTLVVPDAKAYTVEVEVAGDEKALVKAVKGASSLVSDQKRLPPGTAGLLARARGDYSRIIAALYRRGYYGGAVHITIDGTPAETIRPSAELPDPAPVRISVDPGPQFTFGTVHIEGLPQDAVTDEDKTALKLDNWTLTEGQVARSGAILDTEGRLVEMWRQRGRPLAKITTREVVADHRTNTVEVTLVVSPGPAARFGRVEVAGTERVDPEYARWMTGIKPGEPYDPDTLKRARKRLQDLGVFASVAVSEADHVGDDGLLDVTFNLSERKRHLIGGGASYASVDGATLEGYWMHRNLFGRGESLRFDASVSRIFANNFGDLSYGFTTTFRRPGVFTPDTDMTLKLAAEREFVDTYESRTLSGKAGLEQRFNEHLTGSTAFNVEWSDINDAFGSNQYFLVSLPSRLDYDRRNDKLDPTDGLRGTLDAEPLFDVLGPTVLLVAKGSLSGYRAVGESNRLVLAGRVAAGSIVGGSLSDVPATRRFFLGGGGSIRGYEYRSVGPVSGGDVVGGLSFWEASAEMRFHVTDTIGIVPFVDAGAAYEQPYFDFATDVSVGAGVGLRYYTPLGPLRFDVAIPVYPEWKPEDFAFYVGLGQAF
jgi:translocation and assembly module TamA